MDTQTSTEPKLPYTVVLRAGKNGRVEIDRTMAKDPKEAGWFASSTFRMYTGTKARVEVLAIYAGHLDNLLK